MANCCGGTVMEPWATALLGMGVGVANFSIPSLLVRLRIDDPVATVTVHAGMLDDYFLKKNQRKKRLGKTMMYPDISIF